MKPASESAAAIGSAPAARVPAPWRRFVAVALLAAAAWSAVHLWHAGSARRLDAQRAAAVKPGDIVMLSSLTCVYCAQARAWFETNRVPYSECVIERDAACAAAYESLRAPGTPVLLVRGRRLLGFDAAQIVAALSAPGRPAL